jgi:hypothetical protein
MLTTVDAFIEAVEHARSELIRREGRNVSVRELIRRAGFTDSQRPGVAYHLNPQRHTGRRPHRIPADVIARLASVLPITEEELSRAAAVASGLNVVEQDVTASDVRYIVSRFYGSDDVTPEERARATAHILAIIAEESAKEVRQETPHGHAPPPRDGNGEGDVGGLGPTFLPPGGSNR